MRYVFNEYLVGSGFIALEEVGKDVRGLLASALEVAGEGLDMGVELLDIGIYCPMYSSNAASCWRMKAAVAWASSSDSMMITFNNISPSG